MRSRSLKRAAQEREYRKLRDAFLEAHPLCQWCGGASEQVHHKRGRVGRLLTAVEHFAALCARCHHTVTVNPAWAYSVGPV